MKLIKILTSIVLALSCYVMPVKAESHFITDAGFAITYWLASQGLRFSGDLLNFGSGMWNLFKTFLLDKGLTEVDIEALKTKAEQQRYEYDQFGQQVLQIGADLYNYIAQFKEWLIQQFTITPDSESEKKVIFSDKLYNDMEVYADIFGTQKDYFGYSTYVTGIYPTQALGEITSYNGRIAFYNVTVNGQFRVVAGAIVVEVPDNFTRKEDIGAVFTLGKSGDQYPYAYLQPFVVNGKTYGVFTGYLKNHPSNKPVPELKTFDVTDFYQWDRFWYNVTYAEDAIYVGGEVWGADLDSAPTTVSKDVNLITNVPLTSTDEFEAYIKNSLAAGWEIATPTESTAPVEVPSDIQDGEVTANWRSIFPFSLPYDYYLLCNLFVADPVRPEFEMKIFGQTFSYDLSPLDGVMIVFRDCVCIVFIGGLIWATKEIIQ